MGLPATDTDEGLMMTSTVAVDAPATSGRRLLAVAESAAKYGCDERSVFRWADAGLIPFGVKLEALRRWDVATIDAHIAAGCPRVRNANGGGR